MRKRGTTHYCPAWDGRLIQASETAEQLLCACDDHVVADIGAFTTHIRYRGEEFTIEEVVRALRMMPQLRQIARVLAPGKPLCVNNTKPVARRRAKR